MCLAVPRRCTRALLFPVLRNRIQSESPRKRMASQQPLQAQPGPAQRSESLDGLVGVLRTGRLEPAASAKPHGKIRLVEANRKQRRARSGIRARACVLFPHGRDRPCLSPDHLLEHAVLSSRASSAASAAKGASATLLFGCMTMSHPVGISVRFSRTISRTRRRMRLRTTAPPSVLLMLKPNRLFGRSFAFRKTVKWELARRFPAWYTASNSAFLKSLPAVAGLPALAGPPAPAELRIDAELPMVAGSAPRADSGPSLLGRETMASLLAARRQDLASAYRFHSRAESVRLRAPPFPRLICALWQSFPPLFLRVAPGQSYRSARAPIPLERHTHSRVRGGVSNLQVYWGAAHRVKQTPG